MWVLKKTLSRLLFPLPLCLEVLAIGFLLLCFTRKQRAGKTAVALAGILLLLFASHPVSNLLLGPLERRYPPLLKPGEPVSAELRQAKYIVVLGSGFTGDPSRPVESQLDDGGIARLLEGVRIGRLLHCCKLVLSGGPGSNGVSSSAQAMAQLAQKLDVDAQDMILDPKSVDTEEQARFVSPIVGEYPFILVTEASHMPRAMALFMKQGSHPIADPMDFRTGEITLPEGLLPDASDLANSQRAVYEYLGLAWAEVRGKI